MVWEHCVVWGVLCTSAVKDATLKVEKTNVGVHSPAGLVGLATFHLVCTSAGLIICIELLMMTR
jgi:hypothetical protein